MGSSRIPQTNLRLNANNRICKSHPEGKYQVEDSIAAKVEEWGHG
jgi:hypothetical protein